MQKQFIKAGRVAKHDDMISGSQFVYDGSPEFNKDGKVTLQTGDLVSYWGGRQE